MAAAVRTARRAAADRTLSLAEQLVAVKRNNAAAGGDGNAADSLCGRRLRAAAVAPAPVATPQVVLVEWAFSLVASCRVTSRGGRTSKSCSARSSPAACALVKPDAPSVMSGDCKQ